MAKKATKKKETKATEKTEKTTQRAYQRYVQDPVFVFLVVLAILLSMSVFYFASGASCPAAVVVTDDDTNDTDVAVIDDDADVTDDSDKLIIYEFSEFACPYCGAAAGFNEDLQNQFKQQDPTWEAAVPGIKENYGDQVKVEFKHYIVHESARKASEAAECARDQGKFWEYHDVLFQNMGSLEVSDLKGYADDLGLDTTTFDSCLDNGDKASVVEEDTDLGRSLGVSGTPTFFVGGENGWKVIGAQPYSAFEDPIVKALAGEFPAPPPEEGESIGTFDSILLDEGICTEDGKPVVRLFTTTWCPHCTWVGPTYDDVVGEYIEEGKIAGYHWEVDTGDNTLTDEVETEVPESELAVYQQFNPRGSIPTFVFGCKYFRIGTGYEREDNLTAEAEDFRAVMDALIAETA